MNDIRINDTVFAIQSIPSEEGKHMWREELCKLHNDFISHYVSSAINTSLVVQTQPLGTLGRDDFGHF